MFGEEIKSVVNGVENGVGGLVMGLDGIAIETYLKDNQGADMDSVGMEFSFILTQVKKAGESLSIGGLEEMAIRAETMTLLVRMLNEEYFFAVILGAKTNFGKARFLSRVAASKMKKNL